MLRQRPSRFVAVVVLTIIALCSALLVIIGGFRSPAASEAAVGELANATSSQGFLQLPFRPLPGQSYTGLDNVIVWFDHEYPLLPRAIFPQTGLEPETDGVGNTVMIYTGDEKPWCFNGPPRPDCYHYTGHNGYDYSFGVTAGTVISAAHSGFVTIPPFSNCSLYSVNITSDDGRYQTRYLHLGPDVTSAQYVQAGDYIGRVAGVVTRCMKGPHLHLTVLFDANDDGHFVVDERVDPYGWQPFGQTDPWTTTFQDRLGDWHTGTASEWLWSFSPPAHLQVQPEQPARLTTSDGVGLYVPAGAVERTTSLAYVIAPQPTGSPDGPAVGLDTKLYPTLPAGPTFTLTASAGPNQPLAALNRPASLIIDYERARTATVAEDSLSLYWWDRVKGHWRPLPTTLDRQEQVAQAELSQLGLFSLRGRPLQPAPEITAVQWANEDRPDTLIINGRHFAPAPLINLEFNQLEVISATPTSILARIPAWATAGAYGLRLQNPDGQTAFWSPIYYRP